MVTFDSAIPELLRLCEGLPEFSQEVQKAVIVRDLHGRLRLALRLASAAPAFVAKLGEVLRAELGAWFEGPVLEEGAGATGRLTTTILTMPVERRELSYVTPGGEPRVASPVFSLIERRLSKLSWLEQQQQPPPWPLRGKQPLIVTFYSFKGGVGRTTLAAAVALHLARMKKHVFTVDLDLEAPGLGTLLGYAPGPGVLDVIANFVATRKLSIDGFVRGARALADEASFVSGLNAGELNRDYFEKLARLDFIGGVDGRSPVGTALSQMLKVIKSTEPNPDVIILDARAGLHDLAGLSLFGLAHLDVVVARDSEQSLEGLKLVIELLGRRPTDALTLIVQSMAATDKNSDEARRSEVAFAETVYGAFLDHLYEGDQIPALQEVQGHTPWVVRHTDRLLRFTNLDSVRDVLLGPDYEALTKRILELAAPEAAS